MLKRFLALLSAALVLPITAALAQPLAKAQGSGQLSKITVQNVNVKSALDEMRLFYESRPDEVNQARGSGYKPFKRMEWFLETRLNDDGTYPVGAVWNAYIDKQTARQQGLHKAASITAATWTALGPFGLSNPNFPASGTNASSGGRMLDFAFDPNDANVIYAAAASGGLWKSPDDGLSWAPVDDKLPVLAVSCVVVDPNDANTLYIGTGEGYGNLDAVSGVGVLKSTDGGASWSNTGLTGFTYSSGRKVNELIMDPSNSSVLIAATSVGVYRTTDGGANWTQTLTASPAFDLAIDASNSNNVFVTISGAASTGGIYKSTDNGANWTQLTTTNGLPAAGTHHRISMDISASNSLVLYASFTNLTDGLQGVYKSTDGGSNWALTTTTPANYLGNQGWYDNVMAVDPNDANVVYVGGVQAYKTTDGGANWSSVHNNIHVDYHALAFHNGKVYAGNDGGVYKTTDGGTTWTNLSLNGLVTHQYYKFGTSFNNANILMGGAQDNGLNQYSGSPLWTKTRSGDGMEVIYDYSDPTSMIVYGENQNGARLRSTDGGANWTSINTGAPGGPWVTPLEMDPSVPTTLYTIGNTSGGNGDVYKTTNSGSSWSLFFNATEDLSRDIKVAPSDNQVMYVLGPSVVYYTSNGGSTFNSGTGLPVTSSLTYVAVDPTNPRIAYITRGAFAGTHVHKTTDGGATWTNITGTLPNIPAITVAVDPKHPNNVYVGTDLGVYLSTNSGATWSDWTDNLPNVVVDEFEIHAASRLIRAATHGRGMWEANLYEPSNPPVADAGPDWQICTGASQQIGGSPTGSGGAGGYTYLWYPSTGLSSATVANPTATPTATTTYTVRVMDANGVISTDNVVVTVSPNAAPTASVSGDATICAGGSTMISATLTGTSPWNLTWSDGFIQNGVTSSPATRSVSPTSNTTYTVTSISDANCTGTSSFSATVTVNPLPTVTFTAVGPYCANAAAVDLSSAVSPAGGTFSGPGITGNMFDPATAGAGTHTIVYSYTDGNTCTNTASRNIVVNDTPTASISGNDPVVTGTTHTYTATTNASSPSYSWSVTGGSIIGSNTNSTVSITAGGVGTMAVSLNVTDGSTSCSNSATKNVTVNSNTLAANAGDDASVCLGGAANLNGAASGGDGSYTFAWTVQSGPNTSSAQFNDATLEDPTFTPTLTGVYTLRFTVDDGVVSPVYDEVDITVNALPTASVSGDATICAGGSTTISAALTGALPWNLTWSDGFIQNGVTSSPATRSVSPTSNTTYTVTSISDANCTGTSSFSATVTVNPLPTVTFTAVGPYCANAAAVDLSSAVSPAGGTFSGPGITGNMFDPATAGAGMHTIMYSYTDGNSCSNSASQNITVNPLPTASVTGNDPVVTGTTHTYTATTNASSPSYSWSVAGGSINGSNTNSTVSITAGGVGTMNVSVTVTDGVTTCSNSDTKNVTVNANTLAANAGDDASVCLGGAANLNGTASGGDGSYTFAWTVQSGPNTSSAQFSDATLEDPTFTPTLVGVYLLRLTIDDGVVAPIYDEVQITAKELPTATVSGSATICAGASTQISAALTGTGPWNLTWSDGATQNGVTSSPATRNVSPSSNTTYTVTALSDANCSGAASGSAVVTVNPLPTVTFNPVGPFLVTDAPVDLSSSVSPSGGTFSGPGVSGTMFNPSTAGAGTHTVSYSYTDGNSCTKSVNQNITVNGPPGPSVKPFVFVANKVTLNSTKQTTPAGDIHSNGLLTVTKGYPSTYNSNLTAIGKITINKQNTINGNVKSQASISNSGTITGTKTIGSVANQPLPSLSYSAGGANKTVPSGGSLTLAPGSYGNVTMSNGGTLKLTSGVYNLNELRYSSTITYGTIEIDLSSGDPITVNIVSKFQLGHDAAILLLPNGESDSKLATFNTLQSTSVSWGREAYLLGSFNAPNAIVTLVKNSQLRGTICAKEIIVSNDCLFLHHDSPGTLPGPDKLPKFAGDVEEVSSDQSAVTSYQLEQNYPNPFNPETSIRFALPEAGSVTLTVYTLNGQVVKRLVEEEMNAGRYVIVWNGTNEAGERMASGIYLYVIHAGAFTAQRKLVLLK